MALERLLNNGLSVLDVWIRSFKRSAVNFIKKAG